VKTQFFPVSVFAGKKGATSNILQSIIISSGSQNFQPLQSLPKDE